MSFINFRVVTLMDILETSAEAWWLMASMTGQLLVRLEASIPPAQAIVDTLNELRREAKKLGLSLSCNQIDRIEAFAKENSGRIPMATFGEKLRQMVYELNMRVFDELKDRFFLVIPSKNIEYYRQTEPLFGITVENKFPQMSEDIAESGKCLALGQSTASVFHCMRVMEIGVQLLGDKLGVKFSSGKNWQNILDEINKAIKAMDQKSSITRAYAKSSVHLYNVKLCWRNEVMHPKQTYTHEEAKKIVSSVDTFIRDLATVL